MAGVSSWLRPHDAARSSRAPSVASEHPCPGRPLRAEPQDGGQVAEAEQHRRCAHGASRPRSTVLTEAEEATVVEFRRRTLLPLDDVLGCLRRPSPGSPAAPCIVASNATASPGYPEREDRLQA